MCPLCIAATAAVVAGAASTGGVTYNYLDLTPLGRQEEHEPYAMAWVRHHDRYVVRYVV